jgi:hypothetical protein
MGEYRCDMPGSSPDGTCGREACWFIASDGAHRPVCANHDIDHSKVKSIEEVDPKKLPGWWNKGILNPADAVNAPKAHDPVNHPSHYTSHPSGIECITVAEHFNFNLGNALKYIWRARQKNGLEDLKKARWYLDREISRLETKNG